MNIIENCSNNNDIKIKRKLINNVNDTNEEKEILINDININIKNKIIKIK